MDTLQNIDDLSDSEKLDEFLSETLEKLNNLLSNKNIDQNTEKAHSVIQFFYKTEIKKLKNLKNLEEEDFSDNKLILEKIEELRKQEAKLYKQIEENIYSSRFNENFLEDLQEKKRDKDDITKGREFSKQYGTQERKIEYVKIKLEKDRKIRKKMLEDFYKKQAEFAKSFELEIKSGKRNVSKISEDLDCTFFHTIMLDQTKKNTKSSLGNKESNNVVIDHNTTSPENEVKTLLSLQPTIAGSVLSNKINHSNYLFGNDGVGVVITGGNLMVANERDMRTFTSGLYRRRVKTKGEDSYMAQRGVLPSQNNIDWTPLQPITERDTDFQYSSLGGGRLTSEFDDFNTGAIQKKVREKIDIILSIQEKEQEEMLRTQSAIQHNEVVIENPQIGGLFLEIKGYDTHFSKVEIEKIYLSEGATQEVAKRNSETYQSRLSFYREESFKKAMDLVIKTSMPFYILKNGKKYKLTREDVIEVGKIKPVIISKKEKQSFLEQNRDLFKGKQVQKEIDTKLQNIENENTRNIVDKNKDIPIAFDDVFTKASLYWDILKRQDKDVLNLKEFDFLESIEKQQLAKVLFKNMSKKEIINFIKQDIIVLESEAKVYNEYIKLITGYDKKIGFYQDSMFIDLEHFSNFL